MKLRVPDMPHDRSDGRTSDIGVLRTGAGNRDEKKQSRKHEDTKTRSDSVQDHPFDRQGGSIEVEEKAYP